MIIDTDVVEIGFDPTCYTVNEDDGTVTLIVLKTGENEIPITVDISTSVGSAGTGDFTGISRTLTFPPGGDEVIRVPVPIINDSIAEGTEEFFANLDNVDPNDVNLGDNLATIMIIDTDVPTVVPSVPNVEVPEDNGTVTVCFNTTTVIANPLTRHATAEQKTTGNIATAGDDFTPATRTIRFPANPTPTQVCTGFDIINDTIGLEGNEMFTVRVEPSGPESWVTIIDDDVVEVELVEPVYTVPEEDGPASVCLRSNIGTKTELNITVTASEKSPVEAQDGTDFRSGPPRTVIFPAGDAGLTRCIDIEIINDNVAMENEEGFNVDFEFVNEEGVHKGSIPQSMVIITDEDVPTVVPSVPNVEVPENNGTVTVCFNTTTGIANPLTRHATVEQKTTGNIATAGDDFTPATHTIRFPASPTPTQVCTGFDIINDTIGLEGNEMFTVRVEPSGPESWVTIIDDDIVEVEFVEPVYTVPEEDGPASVCLRSNIGTKTGLNITVTASEKSPVEAQDGTDFRSGPPRTVTFPAGDAGLTRCIDIEIINDNVAMENEEGFNVDFEFVNEEGVHKGSIPQSMVIITNEDVPTVVPSVPNVEVPEDNGTVTVCFNTTTGIANPLTRHATAEQKTTGNIATAGDDFTPATRTIRFPASPTPTQVCTSFDIINDTIGLEGNEMFTVRVEPSGPESWVTIIDDDVCEAEGIWNFTSAGTTSYFSCPENTVTITRTCYPSGVWEPQFVDKSLCIPFSSININDTTLANFDNVLMSLSGAVRGAALSESEQTSSNLAITAAVFAKSATLINPTIIIEDEAVQDQVDILGDLQQWNENVLQANASNIVSSFEKIVSVFAQRPRNETFSYMTNNILFAAESVSQTELIKHGRSFSSSGQTGNSSITTLNKDETAATFLPASLFQSITKHDNIGSFYAVYNTAVLFPIAQTDQEMNTSVTTVVGSPVLAATIGLRQNFSELTEPVRILLRLNNLGNVTSGWPQCASWDFDLKQWTTEGCETADINGSVVTCNCTHLTNFAILVDICSRFEDCMPSPIYATLEALTIIGVVLSLIGITATIVTLLLFKKLHERDSTRFHIQLCIALFCMLIIFVCGINQTSVYGGCVFVSVLVHYFTLVAVMWMGAEAILMFQKLVIVFTSITTRYIIAVSLVCWLVPIIPVVIPMTVDLSDAVSRELIVHMPTTEVQGFCFISDPAVFFTTFLGPIFVILLFNAVIFVMVMRVLIKHTQNKIDRTKEQMNKKTAIRLLTSIAGVMSLFGLTWLFGALTVTGFGDARASTAFQVLFVIFNAFQGFFICLFFCVFSKDARESWLELFSHAHGRCKSKLLYSSKTKYSSSGSNTIRKKSSTLSTNPSVIPSNDLRSPEVKEKEQMLEQSNDSEKLASSSQWKEDGVELKACAKDLSTNEVYNQHIEGAKVDVLDNDKPDDTNI